MSTIPQGESLKSPTISAAHSPAASPSPTVLLSEELSNLSENNKPVTIFVQSDPDLTRAIWRALCVVPEVRATYVVQLDDGLQRVDIWKRRTL